jgi:hypothetical protein
MRRVVLGDHQQAGSVLVEPVHDARPLDPADAGKAFAAMSDQRVNQGPRFMPRAGMHHQAIRLVDDDQVVVLIDDIKRDILALRLRGDRRRHVDCDRIPATDMISGVADGGVLHGHLAVEDQRFQPRARQVGQARREHAVEPGRSLAAFDDNFQPLIVSQNDRYPSCVPKMSLMTETVAPDPTPEQAALFARVRRLMLIAGLTTGLAIAAVLIAIGYRLFRSEGSMATAEITAVLPKGAKIVSTGVAGDRVVVTLEVGGTTEIRTFEAHTLKAVGRLRFVSEP